MTTQPLSRTESPSPTVEVHEPDFYRQLVHPRLPKWRLIAGILLFGVLAATSVTAFSLLAVGLQLVLTPGVPVGSLGLTPVLLLGTNLGLASLWPISLVVDRLLFGPAPGGATSATGRLPWARMARTALILLPLFALYGISTLWLLPPQATTGWTMTTLAFLAVTLLTTPLQAAGEEVAFRGLLARLFGGLTARRLLSTTLALLVPSVLFMVAHGAGDPWLNAYYLVFGLSLAVLTWRHRDVGDAMVIHVLNNLVLFLVSLAVGMDLGGMFNREAGTGGAFMLTPMVFIVAVTAALMLRRRIQHRRSVSHRPVAGLTR